MGIPLRRLWKPVETIEGTVKTGEAVFKLAETVEKQKDKSPQIKELVEKIPTLLEALNSPLGQVVSSSLPFVPLATGLIKFTLDVTKKEPTIAQTVAIVVQAAYLESIKETLKSELKFTQEDSKASDVVKKQIRKLGDLEIDDKEIDKEARLALVYFPESKLAQAFNEILSARLQESGIAQSDVETWVKRVAANTAQYISSALAEGGEGVQKLLDWYSAGGKEEFDKYLSIDTYLEEEIKPLPEQKVFKEKFSFQDIYVPLKAIPLDKNGKEIRNANDFILEKWAKEFIINPETADKVIFIQAGAGRGKSVFCRIFADWVRQNLHPLLTPIFIRLRDIEQFEQSFEKTLSDTLSYCDFVKKDSGWLTDRNTRYLFLLDGFDELRMEGRASGGIERFIRQVGQFQEKFRGSETGHRIILTGRPLALQGISYLPDNLERVKLKEMDDDLRDKWLENWRQVVIPDNPDAAREETKNFKDFLESDECPKEIEDKLAREPLLLYLLAKLHKEKEIRQEDFEQASDSTEAKILIYEKSLGWVLKEQRSESLQYQIIGLNIDSLERILTEAGLCVVQSGGEYAKVKMIETRLAEDGSDAANIIKELREKKGEKALKTALGSFYIRPAAGEMGGGVEFYHKSFGEFLCAKRLQESLSRWTTLVKIDRQQQWFISKEQLAEQIYDLLGYGGLTPEIVEYLMGLLKKSDEFRPVELFQRLSDFYWRWCDGEFIDAKGTTLPQTKMRELKEQLPERESYLGQRQVDVYAGLNIMILLLELHRYGQAQTEEIKQQLTFYPCGQPKGDGELADPTLLLRLIGYSNCIGAAGFRDTVGSFLKSAHLVGAHLYSANLSGAHLYSANLYSANLSGANLVGAHLSGANLDSAHLSGVNLDSANLVGAHLSGANLDSAHLSGANLSGANLDSAHLVGAHLDSANLSGANLSGVNLDSAHLVGANLDSAHLVGANLDSAHLSGAHLVGAHLDSANLSGAHLERAHLVRTHLSGAHLVRTHLVGANLSGANLDSAYLSGAYLKGAHLKGAYLKGANLSGAHLERANLVRANLKGANLESANLSGANLKNVRWNEETNWSGVQGLETAINLPEALR